MKKLIGTGLALAAAVLGWACNSGNSGNGGSGVASGACLDIIRVLQQDQRVQSKHDHTRVRRRCYVHQPQQPVLQQGSASWKQLDEREARELRAAVGLSSCESLSQSVEGDACKTAPGMLANGSPCGDDSQCSGQRCDTSTQSDGGFTTTTSSVCGKCVTRPPSMCGDAGACVAHKGASTIRLLLRASASPP